MPFYLEKAKCGGHFYFQGSLGDPFKSKAPELSEGWLVRYVNIFGSQYQKITITPKIFIKRNNVALFQLFHM